MQQLTWIKSTSNDWLRFDKPINNLPNYKNCGIYVIWHGGQKPWTVRVGQGVICDRLTTHTQDGAIMGYRPLGLYVTWAEPLVSQLDGIERFLANELRPLVGDRWPDVVPIPVNLPWAA